MDLYLQGILNLTVNVRINILKTSSEILILFLFTSHLIMMASLTPAASEIPFQSGNDTVYPEIRNPIYYNGEDGLLPSLPLIKKCKYIQPNQFPRFENVFPLKGKDISNLREYLPRHPQLHYPFIVFKISFSQFTAES